MLLLCRVSARQLRPSGLTVNLSILSSTSQCADVEGRLRECRFFAVFVVTNATLMNRARGPYLSIRYDRPDTLLVGMLILPSRGRGSVKLARLNPMEHLSQVFTIRSPFRRTLPPYDPNTPRLILPGSIHAV